MQNLDSHTTHEFNLQDISGRGTGPPPGLPPVGPGGRAGKAGSSCHAASMVSVTNINDVLESHVALEIECVDRLYLNAYVPNLQVGGQVVRFLHDHLGIRSLRRRCWDRSAIGSVARSRRSRPPGRSRSFTRKPDRSRWDDRKLDHVRAYLEAAEREGRFGVVAIVACQEFQWVISARNRAAHAKAVSFEYFREERRVGIYYFYILDPDFGPGFIKICTYFPYPAKVWLNGHEWAKRQAGRPGSVHRAVQRIRDR